MSNLIPVKRVDRNGRLVTRHVKNGAATASPAKRIPEPSVHYYDKTTAVEHFIDVMYARGAASGNVTEISSGLLSINEESRIIVMTALEDSPDPQSTITLCFALRSKDEQFIRSASLGVDFCADYLAASLRRTGHAGNLRGPNALGVLQALYRSHKALTREDQFEVSSYDHERDDTITKAFKAQVIADGLRMKHKVPFHFEYYKQIATLVDNIDDVEAAVPAIVEVNAACRRWASANKKSFESVCFDANDVMAITGIVSDYPHANERIYDIVVDRGYFDPEMVRLSLENASPSLIRGAL